jgi:multiple sugar transport system permease protein/putative spermidine/putrescine transport system permease protein
MSGGWFLRNARLRWLLAGLLLAVAVVVFLLPIGVAVLWSLVNPEEGWFPPDIVPPSYSLANWRALFAVPELADACLTSFAIASMVTLLCALLGLPSGYAIGRRPLRLRRVLELLVLTPLMLPSVVIATGLGSLFIRLGLAQTIGGVVLVQTVVVLPFMIRIVAATFEGMPQDVIDAARNLGAGPLGLTWHVLVPLVLPGLMAGALLSFIGSLQEFLLTFVVGMPRVQTLPILLWSYLGGRSSIWTYGAVVSLVMLAPTVIILFIAERVLKQEYLAAGFGKA